MRDALLGDCTRRVLMTAKIKIDLSWDQELRAFNRDHADIATDPELAM